MTTELQGHVLYYNVICALHLFRERDLFAMAEKALLTRADVEKLLGPLSEDQVQLVKATGARDPVLD